jgi:hypothetical protein
MGSICQLCSNLLQKKQFNLYIQDETEIKVTYYTLNIVSENWILLKLCVTIVII